MVLLKNVDLAMNIDRYEQTNNRHTLIYIYIYIYIDAYEQTDDIYIYWEIDR